MHILLRMLIEHLENLQYNVVSLDNVSDHVIQTKSIKYKNDIHSDGNLFFLSVPEFQLSAVDLKAKLIACVMVKGHKFYIFMQPKGLETKNDG